ncbi:MAG: hypothetical protein WD005_05965 [Haliea sp.]
MTGWRRYAVAVLAGLAGSALWGALMVIIGYGGYSVIGAMLIMLGALVWAREK